MIALNVAMTSAFTHWENRLRGRLGELYGDRESDVLRELLTVCSRYRIEHDPRSGEQWSERDVVLIAYADHVQDPQEHPLRVMDRFLEEMRLEEFVSIVHLLPFYPASSDDGFSVVDYRSVDPAFGDWEDVSTLGRKFDLMFDLVLNHTSSRSAWFDRYLANDPKYAHFYIDLPSTDGLGHVTRPRTSPLLTSFESSTGVRKVWTTFSEDQVDLNFAEPSVLIEMIDVLLDYIRRGARVIRLDAIAYLWKELGTNCIHLPQTHQVVKLLRDVVDVMSPKTLLLTETNVPHSENIDYWGDSDEAHLIYNFSLPPLLLDAILSGDASCFNRWLNNLAPPRLGTNYLNFTASHDGIGVRPLESLIPHQRLDDLVAAVRKSGGRVSERIQPDGRHVPYELNITYFDALQGELDYGSEMHIRRFLLSQALTLALRGIPAVYFPSLFAAKNDQDGVLSTGRARSINRKKYDVAELQSLILTDPIARTVWNEYCGLLDVRKKQTAFHPDSEQSILSEDDSDIVSFVRRSLNQNQLIWVVANFSSQSRTLPIPSLLIRPSPIDLISQNRIRDERGEMELMPYQIAWISN